MADRQAADLRKRVLSSGILLTAAASGEGAVRHEEIAQRGRATMWIGRELRELGI